MPGNHYMLQVKQLDQKLEKWRQLQATNVSVPKKGWIAAIRKSLGLSGTALASRLGVSQSAQAQYEKNEKDGSITLQTLERIAHAMDAELVYAIVPRRPIKETLEEKAEEIARKRVLPLAHSMSLEAQSAEVYEEIEDLKRELLTRPRELWR
jgi:predicted DNA-binding mobile mystery protein A